MCLRICQVDNSPPLLPAETVSADREWSLPVDLSRVLYLVSGNADPLVVVGQILDPSWQIAIWPVCPPHCGLDFIGGAHRCLQ